MSKKRKLQKREETGSLSMTAVQQAQRAASQFRASRVNEEGQGFQERSPRKNAVHRFLDVGDLVENICSEKIVAYKM